MIARGRALLGLTVAALRALVGEPAASHAEGAVYPIVQLRERELPDLHDGTLDDLGWDDPEGSVASDLEAGRVIGFDVVVSDVEPPLPAAEVFAGYHGLSGDTYAFGDASLLVDGLLVGRDCASTPVQSTSWARVKEVFRYERAGSAERAGERYDRVSLTFLRGAWLNPDTGEWMPYDAAPEIGRDLYGAAIGPDGQRLLLRTGRGDQVEYSRTTQPVYELGGDGVTVAPVESWEKVKEGGVRRVGM